MWRDYLTVGLRVLVRNKRYAFINIFGLAIGLAACLMILLYVRYELSYDKWLPASERTYQLQTHFRFPDGAEQLVQGTAYAPKAALIKDFPQVEKAVYAAMTDAVVLRNGQAAAVDGAFLVDGPFFDVLQFPFAKGDPATALGKVGNVVLTETEAARHFGRQDAIGQTLTIVQNGKAVDYRVTGIVRDPPKNSHIALSMVARFDPAALFADAPYMLTGWGLVGGYTYARLRPGADPDAIRSQLPVWEKRNIAPADAEDGELLDIGLVNVRDVHFGAAQGAAMRPGNDMRTVTIFAAIATMILGMACVNFTNLATAQAAQRAREVALRKVVGASRPQLVTQFLLESVLIALLAVLIATAAVELALPHLARFLDADLTMTYLGSDGLALPMAGLVLFVGLAGGLYPALSLSRFQPARVLKANASSTDAQGSGRLRNILVVAQFSISIGLIICTAIIYSQIVFAQTIDPGFKANGLLQIENVSRNEVKPLLETLRREIAAVEGVEAVTHASVGIGYSNSASTNIKVPGRSEPVSIGYYTANANYFDVMGMEVVAGRAFDERQAIDDSTPPDDPDPEQMKAFTARGANIVINEEAAKLLGFPDPQSAIGKQVMDDDLPMNIIGVVGDARLGSVRQRVDDMLFLYQRTGSVMFVRYDSSDPAKLRQRVEAVWRRILPEVPFEAEFSEDRIAEQYRAEERRGQTFAAFALFAVAIACLGLFGLAAFATERRTKEIGIRKVLGARIRDIVQLLAWQFSKPVVIANLVAWPVAWWVMRDWLNTFDARIDLGPGPFLLAGLLALVLAVATVAGHAFRVARLNPIHALRYE